ncbi:RDD family protein [Neobacillus ginsengisoli]|uniref:RDD family membrane protein YckC n=1 Tax=Neobacillus ginsengisoli TaxID=904295 RepID=A0ABT9Y2N4_9BACI|nr:RDD family protein [Neobacillus ginsengisoli]MDQ0201419.1 putative RDD family membrane protein YckC [Neobacillus ginsengisoli]
MNQEQLDIKTPEFVSLQFQLAGLGSRAAAFIIDRLILLAVNILILLVFFFVTEGMSSLPFFAELNLNFLPLAITIIAIFIINGGYFFAFEFFSGGRTIGKRALGIRVIQENGHSLTLLSSFIRNLLRMIDALPVSYFLGFVMMFFHSKHKRIGDIVAGTIVVHERKAKRKKKPSALEKEINNRGLSKNNLNIDEWTLKTFGLKDWELVSTYVNRFTLFTKAERTQLTKQIADILLPKIGIDVEGKNDDELENTLFVLYLILKDEWEFEM